jgi:pilus assembly protein CpaC
MTTHFFRTGFLTVLITFCILAVATLSFAGVPTEVPINKSVILNFNKPAERISVTNPAIADVVLITPRQVQINGLTAGSTSLLVWEKGETSPGFFDIDVFVEEKLAPPAPVIPTKQVLLQVKVAQVDKTSLKKLGMGFLFKGNDAAGFISPLASPDGGLGNIGSGDGIGSFDPLDIFQAGIVHFPSGIGAVLQALATKGYAKILAEPNLLVKSGLKGKLMAGSRIPYTIVSNTGGESTSTIQYIDVGVKLNFAPVVKDDGTIALKIDPAEVSSIAGVLEVNGYPIIDTRTVSTDVELKDGESLIMAGLLQEEQIKTMSKIPLIGDIPILGALFRSTQNDLAEKELVFFITPKLITATPPGTVTELPTDKKLTSEEERELQWVPTN